MARLATGISGFDAMVQGGLPAGSSVVLQGPPGQEKLRFALTFLAEGLKSGASGLVLISSQSPDAVLSDLRGLGVDIDAVTRENRLRIVDWYSWSEETVTDVEERGIVVRSSIDLTNLGVALSRAMAALSGEKGCRSVIELLSPAMNAYELTQVYAFAQSAKRKFDRHGFTSLVLLEKDMHSGPEVTTLLQPFDGVIEIERTRSGDRILRKIGVLHLRDTTPDPTFRVLEMTETGMQVVRESPKGGAVAGVAAEGSVLESQEERARRLSLIMQIARERLKLDPKDADALFAMAAAQATLDDPRGALQSLDRLSELDPAYPGLWVLKTKLHARLGEADRARQSRLRAQQAEQAEAAPAAATVPCPMCDAPVAVDATVCLRCGVKFAAPETLEDELEDLGRAAIQEMVEEEFGEGKSVPAGGESEKKPDREPLPKPAPRPEPKPIPKKGLTNGLVFSRSPRSRAGMTNGLKGRTNGLRGRTNGLTNGMGRTNGLTNGMGRTNGLTNGLGRTNGLTNGLGRTNGLTNGLGRTNGLTNGLGRTNGLTNGLAGIRRMGLRSSGFRGMVRTAGWKLYVIPLVVVGLLLMPLFFVPPYNGPQSPIQIDGQFSDWAGVATEAMASGGVLNPNVDVVRFGVVPNLGSIAFFVEVAGSALMGGGPSPGTMDTVRIFIDIDGSTSTGYRIDGLGADRMIEVSGYAGRVQSSTLWEFDSNRNQRDWSGWIKGTSTPAAASGSRIEVEAQWLAGVPSSVPLVATVHTVSWDKQVDQGDFPVSPGFGTLSIVSDPQVPDVIAGNDVPLLRLTLTAHGQPVSLNSLQVEIAGTAPANVATSLRLTDSTSLLAQAAPVSPSVRFSFAPVQIAVGAPTILFVVGDFASTTGETFGIQLPSIHPFGVSGGVVALRENPGVRALGYLGVVPVAPRVDGAFDEWNALSADPTNDVAPRGNPDIDLTHYGALQNGTATFLYAGVSGRILAGTSTPENPREAPPQNSTSLADTDRDGVPDTADPMPYDFNNDGTPDAQTNCDVDGDGIIDYGCPGGTDYWLNTTIPSTFPAPYAGRSVSVYIGPDNRPPVLGDDAIRMFLDIDNNTFSGYSIGGIGADRLVELRGKDGTVTQSALLAFSGSFPGQWAWTPVAPVTVALGYHAVELSVLLNASKLYVEAGDFWGSVDSTTVVRAFAPLTSSFKVSSASAPLAVPWQQSGPQPTSVLIDPNSNSGTTVYNQQRKVVRAGIGAGATPCDAANSAGCWYTVFYDQFVETTATSAPSTETITTGSRSSGTFPTDILSSNNVYVHYTEANPLIAFVNDGSSANPDFWLTAGGSSYATASWTPPTSGLLVLFVGDEVGSGTPNQPTVSGNSVAWTAIKTINVGFNRFTLFGANSAGSAAGATTVDFAGQSQSGCEASFFHVTNVDLSGGVAAAFVQSPTGSGTAGSGSITLASPGNSANRPVSGWFHAAQEGTNPRANWAEADDGSHNNPGTGVESQWRSDAFETTASASWSTSSAWLGIAAELKQLTDYQMEVRYDWSGIASGSPSYALKVEAYHTVGEDFLVQVLTPPSTWTTRITITKTADDNAAQAYTLTTAEFNSGAPAVRFIGATEIGDVTQSDLYLDYVTVSSNSVWDRVVLIRSRDTSGSTWSGQVVLASGRSGDSALILARDSAEPSIAMDSGGFLHVVWVSASGSGDQSTINLVRYSKTTVAYPTEAQLANPAIWQAVTNVDDTNPGYMPTVSTDSSNYPHIAWSQSKTFGEEAWISYRSNTGTNTVNSPKSRTWDGTSWSAPETEESTAGSPLRNVRMAYSPIASDQRIVVTVSDDGWLDAYVCTPTCTVTNNLGQVWSTPSNADYRFDIAYEELSGRALLVYGVLSTDTTHDIAYREYTGSWGPEQYLDNTNNATDLQYSQIELAPKAGSDQVGLMAGTSNGVVTAWIWSGTAFGSFAEVTATGFASTVGNRMAIAWESNSGHLLAVTATGTLGETIVYREFTTSWSSSSTYPCGTSGKNDYWLSLKPNPVPTTDEMILLIGQALSAVSTCYWSGSGWSNFVAHDATSDSWTTRSEDFAWESTGSRGLLVWGTTSGQITYRTFTAPNTWGTITNVAMGTTLHYWVTLRTNPFPQPGRPKILGAVLDPNDDLGAITWDGSAFTVVGANSFTADTGSHTYENFDLQYHPAPGSVYYKNRAGGTWRPTVIWGTTYTGLSVDVSPQNNYVTLAGYFDNTAEQAAIAYRSNTGSSTINSPKTRTWDGSTWSAEAEQASANNPIRVVRMAWSPTDVNTHIVVTESDDGFLDAYVCTPTCVVTNNIGQVWSTAPASGTPQARFDIAYEQVSGKAVLAYHKEGGSGTQDLAYKTYSGGSWSAEQYIDDPGSASTHYVYSVVKLASKRGSNQIGLIGGDLTNTHVNAWIWDGTAWGNFAAIATTNVGPVDRDNADLAWESGSGNLLAVAASNSASIVSKEYTTSWGSAVTFACASGATIRYTRLKANPLATANDMVLAVVDDPSYNLSTCYWTGSAWANQLTHGVIAQVNFRSFDFAWEASGSKGLLVMSTAPNNLAYRTFTAPNTWGTITTVATGSTDHTWIQARTNPVSGSTIKILGAASENTAQSLGGFKWDGTTFTVIGTSTFTASTGGFMDNEMFDLKYPDVRAGGTGEIRQMVCKDLAVSNCDTSAKFTKWDGTAGIDTVAMGVASGTYPSLATTWDANADLWVAYEKDVNGTSRGIYARLLDYPAAGWQAPETVDSLAGTIFTRPSIGVDKDNNVHALYVSTSGPQLYYKMRTGGAWGSRTAIDTSSDSPSLMVRAPNDAMYGTASGGLYWKSSTSETYFYYIPEFETVIAPVLGVLGIALFLGRRGRARGKKSAARAAS